MYTYYKRVRALLQKFSALLAAITKLKSAGR